MKAIELLIRMHEPKCVSAETESRGRAVITKEQILAALVQAEAQYGFGYHLLMVKYLQDVHSKTLVASYARAWAQRYQLSEQAAQALQYVADMVTDVPLPAQLKRLNSLRNRYMRSHFTFTKPLEAANKLAAEQGIAPNSPPARELRISKLNEARKSNLCPRCRGTGEIGRVQKVVCPECHGEGRLKATIAHLVKSLGVSDAVFKRELNAVVVQFEQHCYAEMSNAEQAIKTRLRAEAE